MVFSQSTRFEITTALILTGPIAFVYMRLFRRGKQAPRLAFLISAIGASTALAEAVDTLKDPIKRKLYSRLGHADYVATLKD